MNDISENDISEKITLFSEDPKFYYKPPRKYSTLYLLRRDIAFCLGINLENKKPCHKKSKAQWLGAMGIFAGIDLLGKFLNGEDDTRHGKVRQRFKMFLSQYFHINENDADDAEILWHLRNSLLHSFGLYSKDFKKGIEYHFTLVAAYEPLISQRNNKYVIDLMSLYDKFESSIESYLKDLMNLPQLRDNFSKMFDKYGSICVGPLTS